MHQAMSISSPLYGMVITTDHTKAENAVRLYDLEGYDDAFLREVAKVEERHSPMKSPNFLSTPQSLIQTSTQDINYSRRSLMGSFEEGKATLCRDELTPKKLDFTAALNSDIKNSYALDKDRAMKVKDWYDKMSNSNVSLPSIELLEAHGELCQEKALLVLSHFPKGGWERDLSVEELRRYKDMEMSEVDGRLCQITSCRKLSKTDWAKQKDNHIVFQCEINCEGLCAFKGPYYEQTNSALQRVFGNGGVLRVHFADHKKNSEIVEGLYRKIAREGIWVGLRHYMFFAYKDPKGKKKQGLIEDISSVPRCFFVCTDSLAFWDCINPKFRQFGSICEARRFMMHIDTVPTLAKKFARLQLALSQTWPLMDLNCPDIKVEIIEDIYCRDKWGEIVSDASGEKLIHTDGTGYVSKDIAARCPASICKGKPKVACNDEEIPLLLQVRLFHKGMVAKGTLLVNFKLPPLTIQVRKSMVKVRRDENITGLCHNSLEICATSRKPGKGKLSPYLALLLRYGGVPEEVLLKFAEEELQEILTKFKSRTAAVSALKNSDQGDHFDSAIRMLVANIPLDEPYISKTLWDLSRGHLQELSTGRVTIPDTYNLMGCADPTGKLDRNQVVIILGHGPLFCPKVLVYKSPGLHVGDVKVLEATWHREFEDIIGNGKYVIFFSVKGPRAVVDEIANSDLDGDQYWCCTNAQVVNHFRPSDVWQNPGSGNKTSTAKLYKNEELDKQHFEAYLRVRFKPSSTMGVAANSWLALMDKFLMLDEQDQGRKELWSRIQSLVNTYYEAVDAEKSGKQVSVKKEDKARYWPHYKERNQGGKSKWINDESTYNSTTVLGKIYDLVKGQWETVDFISRLEKMISEDRFIEKRFQYPSFEIYHKTWEDHFKNYRTKMHLCMHENDGESRSSEIEALLQEYRWELYKADTLIDSPEPLEEVYKQASAIYIVVYTHAQRKIESWKEEDSGQQVVSLGLQFAWRVAAYALINIFRKNSQGKRKEPIFVEESVFRSLKFARRQKE